MQAPNEERPAPKPEVRHSKDEYIALGVYTDCENILEKFLAMRTSTFEDFVKLWKELRFSEIFCGRETFGELLEFTEELFILSKTFILPPHSQIKRIGALYLMYGLYTQQPTQGIVKYRITPQEWGLILKFVDSLKSHGFIDANYIFHKMCLDGAFLTVAYTREYGLERNFRKYLLPWPARDKETHPSPVFDLETLLSQACRSSVKAQANACGSKYNDIKKALSDSSFLPMKGADVDLDTVLQANIDNVIESSDPTKASGNRDDVKHRAFTVKRSATSSETARPSTSSTVPDTSIPSSSDSESLDDKSDDDTFLIQRVRKSKKKIVKSAPRKKQRFRRRNLGRAVQDELNNDFSSTCLNNVLE